MDQEQYDMVLYLMSDSALFQLRDATEAARRVARHNGQPQEQYDLALAGISLEIERREEELKDPPF